MISSVDWMMRIAMAFLPVLRPCDIMATTIRSTMGHCALRKRLRA